ncbi:Uncharacterized protein Rs2_45126 [Raphanus sativus]|nr:Uncharacterized protein Rs2_45126 [Raphanus sativus]
MHIKIYIMAGNKDLKMKAPMVEDYGSTVEEAFKKGRLETTQHYRAKLFMYKQLQEGLMKKHDAELEVSRVAGKLELIEELFNESAFTELKEKLESDLVLATAKVADVEVPFIDWYKLGEPQMFDY